MIYWIARRLLVPLGHDLRYRRGYLALDLLFASATALLIITLGVSVRTLGACLLFLYALIVSLTDFSHMIIPNKLTYSYALVGVLLTLVDPDISLVQSLAGGLTGLVLFWIIAVVGSKAFKRKAMGGGDIKLAVMLGIFIGPMGVFITLFLASMLAVAYSGLLRLIFHKDFSNMVPFGPFLTIAATAFYVWGVQLLRYCRSIS